MKVRIPYTNNTSVLDYLREKEVFISAPCAGKGICGKCKVKVLTPYKNHEEPSYHLACQIRCEEGMEIEVAEEKEKFSIVTDYEHSTENNPALGETVNKAYGIAIDIGTTTVVLALVNLETKQVIDTYSTLNSGKICGADVISRIEYANAHGPEYLQNLMIEDLKVGIEELCTRHAITDDSVKKVIIAGNTTMLHLLMGASCSNLGIYPFTPEFIDEQRFPLTQLMRNEKYKGDAILLPGISTYVGADIVSGIIHTGFHKSESISLLIDIGTNGEMVIGNSERILGLATAAGPAFEGGNISCGTGSIEGAICKVSTEYDELKIQTIADKTPVGICGSGLIDLVAESIKNEWIDETGRMEDEESETICVCKAPKIVLTQQDIRQVQLAKAAIRAGIELLVEKFEIKKTQVDTVYLAGGFGKFIDLNNAQVIGLLPSEFAGKVRRMGNTSLGGAIKYLTQPEIVIETQMVKDKAIELNLANELKFNDYFVQYMLFEEE